MRLVGRRRVRTGGLIGVGSLGSRCLFLLLIGSLVVGLFEVSDALSELRTHPSAFL